MKELTPENGGVFSLMGLTSGSIAGVGRETGMDLWLTPENYERYVPESRHDV